MHRVFFFLLVIALMLPSTSAFSHNRHLISDTSILSCLKNATLQLDEALSLMQKYYYKKDSVDWKNLITTAKARLTAARTCEEANETVNWCFRQISEKHSFIMPAEQAATYNNVNRLTPKVSITQSVGEIKGELLADKGIAYLSVPWVSTSDVDLCTRIADSIQHVISGLDKTGISKWIIDLRSNKGGNCWPMLAGIGPLLGNGVCGYFISPTEKIPISYNNGAAMQGKYIRCRVNSVGYQTKIEKKTIVLLTGPNTSSSGEIVAIAFKGMDQVFYYGEPTAGFTTGNATYTLPGNAMLVLTVCTEADRNGKVYDGKIIPDELISSQADNSLHDAAKSAAIMWLHIQ